MNKEPLKTVYKAVSDRYTRFVRFWTERPNTAFSPKMWERARGEKESPDLHDIGTEMAGLEHTGDLFYLILDKHFFDSRQ